MHSTLEPVGAMTPVSPSRRKHFRAAGTQSLPEWVFLSFRAVGPFATNEAGDLRVDWEDSKGG